MAIQGIKKAQHLYADYTYVPLVLAAPFLARFEDNKPAAKVCRTFAAFALSYSMCTKAKWGVLKIIPYKFHIILDLAAGALALATGTLPVIRCDSRARYTFIAMGATGLLVGTLSLMGRKTSKIFKHQTNL